MRTTSTLTNQHRGERGAAILTVLMISTLLLGLAGTLILTTGMSATTAIDSTTEMQAYYGAEAGLQGALLVLRGNRAPDASQPPLTAKMSFRVANTLRSAASANSVLLCSNTLNDTGSVARLSAWLPYGANGRVTVGNGVSYSVSISDPDDPNRTTLNTNAAYSPSRLLIQSTGYGPRGSVKRMEMMVQKINLDFEEQAMLLVRSADDMVTPMTFSIGSSAAKTYSGHDQVGVKPTLPAFAVTSDVDKNVLDNLPKLDTVEGPRAKVVDISTLPSWLRTADAARAKLNDLRAFARSQGRLFTPSGGSTTAFNGQAGTNDSPQFTFADGDCTLTDGAGLLVVTGTLTLNGDPNFNGIILVLGDGKIVRHGGGSGTMLNAVVVARFARSWPASENGQAHPFLAPTFDTDGGGNADMLYHSTWVDRARNIMGDVVRDVREY